MSDFVERYVRQVGRYLPPKDRADIEAELRSQIQDKLDDRYPGTPTEAEIIAVLAEMGDPHRMAVSYQRDQYLVGPDLYPSMLMVLRHGWLIIPTIVIFLNVFGLMVATQPDIFRTVLETFLATVQAILIFSAVIVLIFAVIQQSSDQRGKENPFNPQKLPELDDPSRVDRFETAFGIALGIVVTLLLVYFLRVGGLTLRFDLANPGEVMAVPIVWLVLFLGVNIGIVLLHLIVWRRNRWHAGLWFIETILEVFGSICLYFVLYTPLVERLMASNPTLADNALVAQLPAILAIGIAVLTLIARGVKQIAFWQYG